VSDLLVRNAHAYTVDPVRPSAEALAIADGLITWVGDDDETAAHVSHDTEVIDAGGATVMPGFIDSHNHVRLGSNPFEVQLAGANTLDEVKARIREHAGGHPDHEWIEGVGFNYSAMPGGRMPTSDDLEGLTGGRPALVLTYDAHNAWLNREAMEIFGITRDTDALAWGHVRKDQDGEPTGIVGDFAVMGISRAGQEALEAVVPGYERSQQYERTLLSLDMATEFGITTIVEPQNSPDDLWIFERARNEGRLRSRLIAAMFHPVGTTDSERDEFDALRERLGEDDRLRIGPIKLYIDDVIEPWTAAMLEPYANRPTERGETFWQPEEFADLVIELERRGWSCHVHGTGDRGLRVALDGFEAARRANPRLSPRHGMVHTECLHADDVPRFGVLGVAPVMQPRHCAPSIIEDWRANVGHDRWRYAWAFRSLLDTGATLAFSSDWNVAEMDPLIGIYTAITRADLDGTGAWVPEETVDLETAIRAYTMGGAHSAFAEKRRGSITPGKQADVVVLSGDLFVAADEDPRRILDLHVTHTIVDGEVVRARS
jgi:predicted amidohydrolase YtcJ